MVVEASRLGCVQPALFGLDLLVRAGQVGTCESAPVSRRPCLLGRPACFGAACLPSAAGLPGLGPAWPLFGFTLELPGDKGECTAHTLHCPHDCVSRVPVAARLFFNSGGGLARRPGRGGEGGCTGEGRSTLARALPRCASCGRQQQQWRSTL